MTFPIEIKSVINLDTINITRTVVLHGGLTVLLGPNGSGKTHLMRGMKNSLAAHCAGKKVRFLSAGRVGLFEQFRSDYDGHRGGNPNYKDASYGSVGDATRRHNYETLQGDFQTLAVRPDILIKIRERLRKLFGRDILVLWDGGRLKVEFVRTSGSSSSYSSAREASGLLHLAGLLTALYDDEVGALLIDEPEVSLHPQLQAFLLKEILSVADLPTDSSHKKLVVIGTHSTEFLRVESPQDLPRLVFCQDLGSDPVQVSPDAGELKNSKIFGLLVRMGQEHKLSFFAKSPLLVEGPSDAIICGALASKLEIHLEAGGSQLLPVIGKGQFPVVVKLLRMIGKSPLVLADADGLADGLDTVNSFLMSDEANMRAAGVGFASALELSRSVYRAFCDLVDSRWTEISAMAESHAYWKKRDFAEVDLTKAKRRAAFATLFSTPESELSALSQDGGWFTIRKRLAVLLDLLESQGCFVLRKGTIESYFLQVTPSSVSDKPTAAAEEVASFGAASDSALQTGYADVLRCLKQAASTQDIVEAESLQDMLLAVAAPALARIKSGAASESLNALSRSTLGAAANLFDMSILDGKLRIELNSKVLVVPGFPLSISQDEDVVKVVALALGLAKAK